MGDDCVEVVHHLYLYLDGELTSDRREAIAAHLDECSPCLGAYDFEADLRVVVSQRCRDRVPEELRLRVAESLGITDLGGTHPV